MSTNFNLSPKEISTYYSFVKSLINRFPDRIPQTLVSEFIEDFRVMPAGTPHEGKWRNSLTPHLVEIMDFFSATNRLEEMAVMKSAQIGLTAAIENVVAYIIKVNPNPTMYMSANEALLKKWINKRLIPLLISCALTEEIKAQHVTKGSRRTGNTMFSKEFPGGWLEMVTANSAPNIRSDSVCNVVMDELEGYPDDIGNEGDPKSIADARTDAWEGKKKKAYISTPGLEAKSKILPIYEAGDQRKWFVPCPFCGERQVLEWTENDQTHGLRWDLKNGLLDKRSVRYVCIKCKRDIKENYKYRMMQGGVWIPTSTSYSELAVSYHFNSLSSMLLTWRTVIEKWLKVVNNITKKQTFENLVLGLPHREIGERPKAAAVYNVRGSYKKREVPNEVLFLTAGIDVQRGKKNDKTEPPRLEMEVVGFGLGYKTFSIDYKIFKGPIDDPNEGAWKEFDEWAKKTNMLYYRKSDNRAFGINNIFIDSADGQYTDLIYNFADRYKYMYACRGAKPQDLGLDPNKPDAYRRYRKSKVGDGGIEFYLIHTPEYKKALYNALRIKRRSGVTQSSGFCDFPEDYTKRYFNQLTAAEMLADGSFYLPRGRRDEVLSCRVMAMAASNVFLDNEVKILQSHFRREGRSLEWIKSHINHRFVLDQMKNAINTK